MVAAERKWVDDRTQLVLDLKNKVCKPGETMVIINQKGIDPLSATDAAPEPGLRFRLGLQVLGPIHRADDSAHRNELSRIATHQLVDAVRNEARGGLVGALKERFALTHELCGRMRRRSAGGW